MEIIIANRGGGKTTELIKRAAEEEGTCIVCKDKDLADRTHKEAFYQHKKIMHPITFKEFLDKSYMPLGIKKFLIDDVDLLLKQLASTDTPIEMISISGNERNAVSLSRQTKLEII